MLDLVLDPLLFQIALAAFALATPLGAWALWRARPALRGRVLLACGGFGPAALVLWGAHNLAIAVFGFASILATLLVLALGAGAGLAAGLWIRAEPAR